MLKRLVTVVLLSLLPLPAAAGDCVVLLHGLARQAASMEVMATALREQGYHVVNEGYASTEAPVADLARGLDAQVAQCPAGAKVHFVTQRVCGALGILPVILSTTSTTGTETNYSGQLIFRASNPFICYFNGIS